LFLHPARLLLLLLGQPQPHVDGFIADLGNVRVGVTGLGRGVIDWTIKGRTRDRRSTFIC
jgi:hypothetical protein